MKLDKQINEMIDDLISLYPEGIDLNVPSLTFDKVSQFNDNKLVYQDLLKKVLSVDLEENSDFVGSENIIEISLEDLDELLKIDSDDVEFLELL